MKYTIFSILLLIISILIPILVFYLIERSRNKKYKMWIKIIIITISSLLIILSTVCTYLGIFYRSTSDALESLKSDNDVIVYDTNDYYFFDNKANDNTAIIFYPGAKVEESAYAPLMHNIAENGIDVYLIKMPFHFSLLGIDNADYVLDNTKYDNIYLMGHSLGGTAISNYLLKTNYSINGIIYLASYPNKKISDNVSSLSIYGSNDKVLTINNYNKNKDFLPQNNHEFIITGGNHGYFGNYGEQSGDGVATITREEQQNITTNIILNYIMGNI